MQPGPIARRVAQGGGRDVGDKRLQLRQAPLAMPDAARSASHGLTRTRVTGRGDPVPLFVNLVMASEAKHDTGFNPNQSAHGSSTEAASKS